MAEGKRVPRRRNRNGATAAKMEMMPRQHSDDPVARRDTGVKGSGCERVMQGWWGSPDYRVPTCRYHDQRETCKEQSHKAQTRAFHTTYTFVHGRSSRGIPSKGTYLERVEFDGSGSRCSRT